ncbi:hypothetical protein OG21DRAFT_1511109 [Imleria badia]|nr:hypothetical protein OG21DRAFT_1511109 [Imleria badia]
MDDSVTITEVASDLVRAHTMLESYHEIGAAGIIIIHRRFLFENLYYISPLIVSLPFVFSTFTSSSLMPQRPCQRWSPSEIPNVERYPFRRLRITSQYRYLLPPVKIQSAQVTVIPRL